MKPSETQKYLDYLLNKWVVLLGLGQWNISTQFVTNEKVSKHGRDLKNASAWVDHYPQHKHADIYVRKLKGNKQWFKDHVDKPWLNNIERRFIHEMLHLVMPNTIQDGITEEVMENYVNLHTNLWYKQFGDKN